MVFPPLGVIPRTKNKIVEIVTASECYLIINPFKTKESKENVDGKMSIKKEKNFLIPNLQYYQFEQDGRKNIVFFRKNKLNMKLVVISRKCRLLRKSATILHGVK